MSNIINKPGFSPQLRGELALRDAAMAGDIAMVITPATVNQLETTKAWSRTVEVELRTAAGKLHDWFTGSFASKVSVGDTSTAGTAAIASTTLSFVAGRALIDVTSEAAAWVANQTNTLTIGDIVIMGKTVTGGTSVGTIVKP